MCVIGAELPMGVPLGAVLRCGDACLRTNEVAALAMVLAQGSISSSLRMKLQSEVPSTEDFNPLQAPGYLRSCVS